MAADMAMTAPETANTAWAFARYEGVRATLPAARFPDDWQQVPDLTPLIDRFDAFVLDAYGVLNVGEAPIPGAAVRLDQIRAARRRLVVLTNGASSERMTALARYRALGLDLAADEVVASRDVARDALLAEGSGALWAAISYAGARLDDLAPLRVAPLAGNAALWRDADGFLFLGSQGWDARAQARLVAALTARPRPVVIANPDVVAPLEGGFSLEPGHFGHALADIPGVRLRFLGKPFPEAFTAALDRLGNPDPARVAMEGDTLHTDILGGRAAGMGTVLIARHGLFRGHDPAPFITASGIVPDYVAQTT